jgi:surface antigen
MLRKADKLIRSGDCRPYATVLLVFIHPELFTMFRPSRLSYLPLLVATLLLGAAPALAQTYGTDQRYCDRSALGQVLSTSKGNIVGSLAGAALGGLLGNQVGKGRGNALATLAGVVGGALAGGYVGRSMDPTDQACVGQTLEHTPTSQTVAWQDPNNGSSYWVTPTADFRDANGEPCRNYITQAVINGQPQRAENTACRQPNGSWQPVAYQPPQAPQARRAVQPRQEPTAGSLSSDMILKVQQRLHDKGFYVRDNIDGEWGPHTMAALRNFQRAQGLPPSGQLDLQTLSALGLSANTSAPSSSAAQASQ